MKCRNCNEEYDEEMFPVCPYCLSANEELTNSDDETSCLQEIEDDREKVQQTSLINLSSNVDKMKENIDPEENSSVILAEEAEYTNDEIEIADISELSTRSKNALHRKEIFNIGQLREYVEKYDLSDIRNLGEHSKKEILDILEKYKEKTISKLVQNCDGEEKNINDEDRLFSFINDQLYNLSIELLSALGISSRTINKLVKEKISKI